MRGLKLVGGEEDVEIARKQMRIYNNDLTKEERDEIQVSSTLRIFGSKREKFQLLKFNKGLTSFFFTKKRIIVKKTLNERASACLTLSL